MKIAAVVGVSAAFLTACAAGKVESLNSAKLSGKEYRDKLAINYAQFARYEHDEMYDGASAGYFADKGMKALKGESIEPEQPGKWKISNADMRADLESSRARLMSALAKGAAAKLPAASARALVSYDCWVEQADEGWQYSDIQGCRSGFKHAMAEIDADMMKPVAAVVKKEETVTAAPTPKKAAAAPDQYLLFFDWDSAVLDSQARQIVRTAAENARRADVKSIILIGHADKSGPTAYNQRLSIRRANSVADELGRMGFPADSVLTSGRGETEPLVPTADGVREPQNRRVNILFGDRRMGS